MVLVEDSNQENYITYVGQIFVKKAIVNLEIIMYKLSLFTEKRILVMDFHYNRKNLLRYLELEGTEGN